MKKITLLLALAISTTSFAQCWQKIVAATTHSLAIRNDGTLWAWGANSNGQLGIGSTVDKNVQTQVGTDNNWINIAAGSNFSLGLKSDGTLWTWGGDNNGQLGNGSITGNVTVPTQIGTDTDWQNIFSGSYAVFAIKSNGTLWSWGENNKGQLGVGGYTNRSAPTQVGTDTNWQKVSGGTSHTLAIKTDGTLWAAGYNLFGQLGLGDNTDKTTFNKIGTDTDWQGCSAGGNHSMANKVNGVVYTWGLNTYGQLGDGSNTSRNLPNAITDQALIVEAGFSHSTVITTDHYLYTWGQNDKGQLGTGSTGIVWTPTLIGTASDRNVIAAGNRFTLLLNVDGFLYVAGSNDYGQLGDGTLVSKNTFTSVACAALSIDDVVSSSIKVYPNPFTDSVTISHNSKINSISIFNILGQQVISKKIDTTEETIDTSLLQSGSYVMKVTGENTTETFKLIKK